MRINRYDPATMPNDHNVTVAAQLIAKNHRAMIDRLYWRPLGSGDIDTVMKAGTPSAEP